MNVVAVLRLFAVMDIRGNKVVSGTFIVKFYSFSGASEQDRKYTYKSNIDARSSTRCFSAKSIIITGSECVSVALGIQHARRIHLIVLSPVTFLAVPYFSTLS